MWDCIVCSILSLLVMKNQKYVGPCFTIHHRTNVVNCTIIALTTVNIVGYRALFQALIFTVIGPHFKDNTNFNAT